RTREEIKTFPLPEEVHRSMKQFMQQYINRYDKKDKFYLGGYNVNFDHDFLLNFFQKNDDKFFGSYFNHRLIDPLYIVRWLEFEGIIEPMHNHKLVTICKRFGIEFDAHDAVADVRATMDLNTELRKLVKG
ncbi:MAG: 3'-5' exonuclease, partial [Candidatus Hodarchaeales archaeon]